jgi:hypothetical protein
VYFLASQLGDDAGIEFVTDTVTDSLFNRKNIRPSLFEVMFREGHDFVFDNRFLPDSFFQNLEKTLETRRLFKFKLSALQ